MGAFYAAVKCAATAGSCLWLVGCGCPEAVNGIHNGDTIRTTIVERLPGPAPASYSMLGPCVGLYDIVPGTTLTLGAGGLGNGGEECGKLDVEIAASTSPPGSQAPAMGGALVDASDGCSGDTIVQFVAASPSLSVYHDDPDGGPYETFLEREFNPAVPPRDGGGTCPIRAACVDHFVARNTLVP